MLRELSELEHRQRVESLLAEILAEMKALKAVAVDRADSKAAATGG